MRIEGARELQIKLKRMSEDAARNATKEALHAGAVLVHGEADERCPVDTGYLKSSLNYTVEDIYAEIGTPVEYAPYVEMGTSRQTAQPFLRPALDTNIRALGKLFAEIYAKHIKGAT